MLFPAHGQVIAHIGIAVSTSTLNVEFCTRTRPAESSTRWTSVRGGWRAGPGIAVCHGRDGAPFWRLRVAGAAATSEEPDAYYWSRLLRVYEPLDWFQRQSATTDGLAWECCVHWSNGELLPEISNNVGSVKLFMSALLLSRLW